jgi:hypothetical protein
MRMDLYPSQFEFPFLAIPLLRWVYREAEPKPAKKYTEQKKWVSRRESKTLISGLLALKRC